jgi:amino acid transporter
MQSSSNKLLGLKDISLMTFLSNFGVRWFAIAAGLGAQSMLYWVLGAVFFFVPLTIIVTYLSKLYPEEGGMYAWTKNTLGDKAGFLMAWLYFINMVFYYPAILIFLSTNLAYFLGDPSLAQNSTFIVISVLVAYWFITGISLFGLKANKFVTEYGGFIGTLIPTVLLIVLGFVYYFVFHHSATHFSLSHILHGRSISGHLETLSIIMFAMAGIEIIPTFANSVRNPKRDLVLGLALGALAIVICYVLGTVALNIVLSPEHIRKTSGFIQAFEVMGKHFHWPWLAQGTAFLLIFAELAAVSIWLLAPVTMFFKCTPKGSLPAWIKRANKDGAPANALLAVGALVTVVTLVTNLLPNVNAMYQILILMTTVLYFIPYLLMVFVFCKNLKRLSGIKRLLAKAVAACIFVSLSLGILFAFEPPAHLALSGKLLYEGELIFGVVLFVWLGFFIYKRGNHGKTTA